MNAREAASAIDDAVNRAELEEVKELLDAGIDANVRDIVGDPILISAAWVGAADIVALLIERGADVNAVGRDGQNALQKLLSSSGYWYEGHDRVIETLRRHGSRE